MAGHSGCHKIYDLVACHYWWFRMVKMIRWFVHNCHICAQNKTSWDQYHRLLKPLSVPEQRWAHISMNFIVGLSPSISANNITYSNILVVVDRLTKMRHLIPCQFMTKEETACLFHQHVWKHHGLPFTIVSDRGTQFITHFWDKLCHRLDIKSVMSTAYHSETNDQTENTNTILEQYLQAYIVYLQDDWVNWLSLVEW